jgi:peptide deformylase
MEIRKFPDKRLFTICKEVEVFNSGLKKILDDMWETMKWHNGIGLSSNQVGYQFRFFVMEGPNLEKLYIVNPKIVERSIVPASTKEGCLSAPGDFVIVSDRASWVLVTFQDENGREHAEVFSELHAVCFQHETDHLDGIAFFQSKTLPRNKRKELEKKWGTK